MKDLKCLSGLFSRFFKKIKERRNCTILFNEIKYDSNTHWTFSDYPRIDNYWSLSAIYSHRKYIGRKQWKVAPLTKLDHSTENNFHISALHSFSFSPIYDGNLSKSVVIDTFHVEMENNILASTFPDWNHRHVDEMHNEGSENCQIASLYGLSLIINLLMDLISSPKKPRQTS